MKYLLSLLALAFAFTAQAATFPNRFTTNADGVQINGSVLTNVPQSSVLLWHNGVSKAYAPTGDGITNAVFAAVSGDGVKIGPGTYFIDAPLNVPTNGFISGAGMNETVLVNRITNATVVIPMVHATDGGTLDSLTISNLYQTGANPVSTLYQACVGTHSYVQGPFRNFSMVGVKMLGGTDALYIRHTNACSFYASSCVLTSHWDVCVLFDSETGTNSGHTFTFDNCTFANALPKMGIPNGSAISYSSASNTFGRAINCKFYMMSSSWQTFGTGDSYANTPPVEGITFTSCSFTNLALCGINNGDKAIIAFEGACSGLNPVNVNDNLSSGANLQYPFLVVSKLQFGGDADDGAGPSVTNNFPTDSKLYSTGGWAGNGASLTALNASSLSSGTVPDLRLAGANPTFSGLSVTGAAPGAITLKDLSNINRLQLGPSDNLSGSNTSTGFTFGLTNGGAKFDSNVVASTFYGKLSSSGTTNSALTASALMATDANKAQASVTIGSGLTYSGGTLSASGGSVSPTTMTQTNFVLNTVYTNGSQAALISGVAALNGATVSGVASLAVLVDDAGGTTFAIQGESAVTTTISLALNATNSFAVPIKANATYYLTNNSSGSGNASSLVAGTGKITTISSGTNGATGATGATGAASPGTRLFGSTTDGHFSTGNPRFFSMPGTSASSTDTAVATSVGSASVTISDAFFSFQNLGAGTNAWFVLVTNGVSSNYSNQVQLVGTGAAMITTSNTGSFVVPANATASWSINGNNPSQYGSFMTWSFKAQ